MLTLILKPVCILLNGNAADKEQALMTAYRSLQELEHGD